MCKHARGWQAQILKDDTAAIERRPTNLLCSIPPGAQFSTMQLQEYIRHQVTHLALGFDTSKLLAVVD